VRVYVVAKATTHKDSREQTEAPTPLATRLFRKKQIPLCAPRPPKCGGKEKARDSVRDDTFFSLANLDPSP